MKRLRCHFFCVVGFVLVLLGLGRRCVGAESAEVRGFSSGEIVLHWGANRNYARALYLQSDGSFLVAGRARNGINDADLVLHRFYADGTFDVEFNSAGVGYKDVGTDELVHSIAVDSANRILVSGRSFINPSYRPTILRFDSGGWLDAAFSGDGAVYPSLSSHAFGRGIAADSSDRIVMGGYAHNGTNYDFMVVRYLTNGSLDTTFGTDGIVTMALGEGHDVATGLVLQSDDKIVLAGMAHNGFDQDLAIARYQTNGSLDTVFSNDGYVTYSLGSHDGDGQSLEVGDIEKDSADSNATYSTLLDGTAEYIQVADHADWDASNNLSVSFWVKPNTSDSRDVFVSRWNATGNKRIWAVAFDTDTGYVRFDHSADGNLNTGNTAVTSNTLSDGTWHHIAAIHDSVANENRIYIDGTQRAISTSVSSGLFDSDNPIHIGHSPSFDGAGRYFDGNIDEVSIYDTVLSTADVVNIYNSGNPVTLHTHAKKDALLGWWRMGDLDHATESGGFKDHGATSGESAMTVELLSNNRILIGGRSNNKTDSDFAVVRLLSSGALDTQFATDGKYTLAVTASQNDSVRGVTVDGQGRISLAGRTYDGTDWDFAMVRLLSQGTLDTTFSTDGKTVLSFESARDDFAYAARYQENLLIAAGITHNANNSDVAIARFHNDGTVADSGDLDKHFGTDGKIVQSFGTTAAIAYGLAVQSDGKPYLAGATGDNPDMTLSRFLTDGSADTTFHTDGIASQVVDTDGSELFDVALQANGRPVVVGRINGFNEDMLIAKYLTSGLLDTTFTADGVVTLAIGTGSEAARSVAIQSNERIVVVGETTTGTDYALGIVRYLTTGTVDTTFTADGVVTTTIGTGNSFPNVVKLHSDQRLIVAGYSYNGSDDDFVLARYLTSGALDTTFSTDGVVTTGIGTDADIAYDLHFATDGTMVVTGLSYNGSNNDFAVIKYLSNGALDTRFSTDGVTTVAVGTGADVAHFIGVHGAQKIVLGGLSSNGSNNDYAVARLLSDGSLDSTFSADGVALYTIGTAADQANAGVVTDVGKVLLGGVAYDGTYNDFSMIRIVP